MAGGQISPDLTKNRLNGKISKRKEGRSPRQIIGVRAARIVMAKRLKGVRLERGDDGGCKVTPLFYGPARQEYVMVHLTQKGKDVEEAMGKLFDALRARGDWKD